MSPPLRVKPQPGEWMKFDLTGSASLHPRKRVSIGPIVAQGTSNSNLPLDAAWTSCYAFPKYRSYDLSRQLLLAIIDEMLKLPDVKEASLGLQRAIAEAISRHDPLAARQAAQAHMTHVYRWLES